MKQYNYGLVDEHIQWLIEMMNIEFPNGYELIIDSNGAEIRSAQQYLNFLKKDLKSNSLKKHFDDLQKEGLN